MPRTSTATPSKELLEAAVQGLELQRQRLDEQIEQVRNLLGKRPAGRPAKNASAKQTASAADSNGRGTKKRTLSAEARKRIAAAQKKRWANFRKSQQ